jgi:8-oxo-dGTP pyrophosphatase MutT (NUDIX family)
VEPAPEAERAPGRVPVETGTLRSRIRQILRNSAPSTRIEEWRLAGLPPVQSQRFRRWFPDNPVPAAVLVPIVDYGHALHVLLTQRASHLKNHAGQISFPGGRIEAGDEGPLAAALRETSEEIGLGPEFVTPAGYLPDHLIVSGYRVTPVVAWVRPGFRLALDATEVEAAFEVPLAHVFDPANHLLRRRQFGDEEVDLYDIPFGERDIWGATAGMLLTFYRLVTGAPTE